MRAKRPVRVLLLLLAVGLLPASAVLATHFPQVSDVVAVAANPDSYNMSCKAGASQVDCSAFSLEGSAWAEFATIKPGSGDLVSLNTTAAVDPFFAAPLDPYFRTWMTDLHAVPCNGISRELTAFVFNVGNLGTDETVTPLTITGECHLTGGLNVKRNVDGRPTEYDYWVNSAVIAPPAPTASPTPTAAPTATPKPTATPTGTPNSTATPRPTATATATATPATSGSASASASASASVSASASETETPTPSETPEQSVRGEAFSPEPSIPDEAPDQGVGGWPGSIPGAGDVSTKAADVGGSALAALLMLVAMGFIGELFNNTTETNYDRILAWWKKSWVGRIGRGFAGLFGGGST
jgi:hypothetical protein